MDWDAEGERGGLESWGRTQSGMPDDIAHRDTTEFASRKAPTEPDDPRRASDVSRCAVEIAKVRVKGLVESEVPSDRVENKSAWVGRWSEG